mgnify:CR=1 FL=1
MPGGRDMAGGGSGLTPDVAEVLARDSLQAAPALLGAIVTTTSPEGTVSVRLTEVEAYRGEADPGSHAFRGRTARNASMFEAGGIIYVYFTYGMHHCVNVVTGPEGLSRAVLMRGGEVVAGVELARRRRPAARPGCARRGGWTGPTTAPLWAGPGRASASLCRSRA